MEEEREVLRHLLLSMVVCESIKFAINCANRIKMNSNVFSYFSQDKITHSSLGSTSTHYPKTHTRTHTCPIPLISTKTSHTHSYSVSTHTHTHTSLLPFAYRHTLRPTPIGPFSSLSPPSLFFAYLLASLCGHTNSHKMNVMRRRTHHHTHGHVHGKTRHLLLPPPPPSQWTKEGLHIYVIQMCLPSLWRVHRVMKGHCYCL